MLFKTVLTSLLIGAISVNALSGPIARSPVPEQESQQLEARQIETLKGRVREKIKSGKEQLKGAGEEFKQLWKNKNTPFVG